MFMDRTTGLCKTALMQHANCQKGRDIRDEIYEHVFGYVKRGVLFHAQIP